MSKPILLVLDDDASVLKSVQRDLRSRYRKDYRIMSTTSASEALESLTSVKNQAEEVALFLSDQRMPEMLGVDFLKEASHFFPAARKVLLTAYSDTEAAIRAINSAQVDYYLLKPWDPPEEKLYPVLDDLLEDWQAQYRPAFKGIRILGNQWSPASHQIKDFLSGNLIPYRWIENTAPEGAELMKVNQLHIQDLPVVLTEEGEVIRRPSLQTIGEKLGMSSAARKKLYDVVIIGAGPAGLAAGVYGGSEGLQTLLIEKRAPGGQAGTSSRIENYLGFPKGLSGADLSRRAITQATRFGVEFLSPQEVENIEVRDRYKILTLKDGTQVNSEAIIITTGVNYRKHPAQGIDQFTGAGIYYGAATTEAGACRNEEVYIVGGGNSAGQAAVYLSNYAKKVTIVIRKPDLTSSMSSYLIDQLDQIENIEILGHTEVKEVRGSARLEEILLSRKQQEQSNWVPAAALFIFIGARPVTDWLGNEVIKNAKGFIETGKSLQLYPEFKRMWKEDREPLLLESSIPGIFAAGDVRAGAMNRVASAVGEGSMAIKLVHEYLALK
jgi:thioredoxin reductase (NADPH)